MKKLSVLFYAVVCITSASCMHNDRDINISFSEAGHYYFMDAILAKTKQGMSKDIWTARLDEEVIYLCKYANEWQAYSL